MASAAGFLVTRPFFHDQHFAAGQNGWKLREDTRDSCTHPPQGLVHAYPLRRTQAFTREINL